MNSSQLLEPSQKAIRMHMAAFALFAARSAREHGRGVIFAEFQSETENPPHPHTRIEEILASYLNIDALQKRFNQPDMIASVMAHDPDNHLPVLFADADETPLFYYISHPDPAPRQAYFNTLPPANLPFEQRLQETIRLLEPILTGFAYRNYERLGRGVVRFVPSRDAPANYETLIQITETLSVRYDTPPTESLSPAQNNLLKSYAPGHSLLVQMPDNDGWKLYPVADPENMPGRLRRRQVLMNNGAILREADGIARLSPRDDAQEYLRRHHARLLAFARTNYEKHGRGVLSLIQNDDLRYYDPTNIPDMGTYLRLDLDGAVCYLTVSELESGHLKTPDVQKALAAYEPDLEAVLAIPARNAAPDLHQLRLSVSGMDAIPLKNNVPSQPSPASRRRNTHAAFAHLGHARHGRGAVLIGDKEHHALLQLLSGRIPFEMNDEMMAYLSIEQATNSPLANIFPGKTAELLKRCDPRTGFVLLIAVHGVKMLTITHIRETTPLPAEALLRHPRQADLIAYFEEPSSRA